MASPAVVPGRARLPNVVRARRRLLAVLTIGASFVAPVTASLAQSATPEASLRNDTREAPLGQELPAQSDATPFGRQTASRNAHDVVAWILKFGDNQTLPFVIIDKIDAKVFVFDGQGRMQGAAPALLGLGRGDESIAGIGKRKLATIRPEERTTPAGRFQASLGRDFEQDILWVDYDAALSLHRVITGNPKDRRQARLASVSPDDNRISYGCINVPADFYDRVVVPAFTGTVGIVYILPEAKSLDRVFPIRTERVSPGR